MLVRTCDGRLEEGLEDDRWTKIRAFVESSVRQV
jgi:hypothetical protein